MLSDATLVAAIRAHELLRPAELAELVTRAQVTRESLYRVTLASGRVNERALVLALGEQLDVACVSLQGIEPDAEAGPLLSGSLCWQRGVFPVGLDDDGTLYLAMVDPLDRETVEELSALSDLRIEPVLVGPVELDQTLRRFFGPPPAARKDTIESLLSAAFSVSPSAVGIVAPSSGPQVAPPPAPEALTAEAAFEELFDEGVEALLCKDYVTAWQRFQAAAKLRPDDGRVQANLARLAQLGHGG